MEIKLHKLARTTPATRAYIQQSAKSAAQLSRELGVSQRAVYKWRHAGRIYDASHARHNLGASTSATDEAIIAELRQRLRLSLDDIVEVLNRCLPKTLSRSAVYRCLRRLDLTRLPAQIEERRIGVFEDAPCGFIHIDLKVLSKLNKQASYVFVAVDRATRYVFVALIYQRDARTISRCLSTFIRFFPQPVHTILTDNDGASPTALRCSKRASRRASQAGRTGLMCCALSTALRIA